ncbi:MAG: DUF2520 domain-containing protein [bacterium]|nr:DUF2520 domain-containing protein [bacterium]
MKICIIGPGKVGTALGEVFQKAGYEIVGIVSEEISKIKNLPQSGITIPKDYRPRTCKNIKIIEREQKKLKELQKCIKLTGCKAWSDNPRDLAKKADLVLITVPDSAIKGIVSEIRKAIKPGTILVHTSGSLPASVLEVKNGIAMHPISAFVGGKLLPGTYFSIEGNIKIGKKLVCSIGGIPIVISPKLKKVLYHSGLNFGAAYFVTLLSIGKELLELSGFEASEKVILSLAESVLSNAKQFGIKNSFTGPIARGDKRVVEEELKIVKESAPDIAKIYELLIKETEKYIRE